MSCPVPKYGITKKTATRTWSSALTAITVSSKNSSITSLREKPTSSVKDVWKPVTDTWKSKLISRSTAATGMKRAKQISLCADFPANITTRTRKMQSPLRMNHHKSRHFTSFPGSESTARRRAISSSPKILPIIPAQVPGAFYPSFSPL